MLAALALSTSLVIATCAAGVPSAHSAPASPLVRWRPLAWSAPATGCGAPASELEMLLVPARSVDGEVQSLADARAAARAAIRVRTRPDGSRYAIVAGAFRVYTIATFDADGGVQTSCVGSRAEALRSVAEANAKPTARATPPKEK
jgi:hypothetical protein